MTEEINYHKGYDKGFSDAQENLAQKFDKSSCQWINISERSPKEGVRLLYFFEGTGAWLGFYYGRDESYPDPNNHVFGSSAGFLTGDVTHWCYMPEYPEGEEWRIEADVDFHKETKKEIEQIKKEIGYE